MKKIYSLDECEKLNNFEVVELYKKFVNPYQAKIFSSFAFGEDKFVKAEGMYMYTNLNEKILDFTGGFGVLNLGHNHPRILKIRENYAKNKKMEVHKQVFSNYLAALSHNIAHLADCNLEKVFLCNSGAEAVEAAIKLSSGYNNKKKYILSSDKSYHGKLIGSGSISGSYKRKNNFPKMENVKFFQFNDPDSLEKTLKECEQIGGVYAVIIEPFSATLLEECSENFIKKLIYLKKKYDFLIICDEVYSAWFKCGYLFYYKKFNNFEPDILVLSKSLGGGKASISATISTSDVYNKVYGSFNKANLHTTTYNGFGEECATAIESINVIIEDNYQEKVNKIEKLIFNNLEIINNNHKKKIKFVKGRGAFWGIEFNNFADNFSKLVENTPLEVIKNKSFFLTKILPASISSELYKKYKILTFISESDNSNFLYIAPSLIVEEEQISYFFNSLNQVLKLNNSFKFASYLINTISSALK